MGVKRCWAGVRDSSFQSRQMIRKLGTYSNERRWQSQEQGREEADRAAGRQILALVKCERAGHYLTLAVCEDIASRKHAQSWQKHSLPHT